MISGSTKIGIIRKDFSLSSSSPSHTYYTQWSHASKSLPSKNEVTPVDLTLTGAKLKELPVYPESTLWCMPVRSFPEEFSRKIVLKGPSASNFLICPFIPWQKNPLCHSANEIQRHINRNVSIKYNEHKLTINELTRAAATYLLGADDEAGDTQHDRCVVVVEAVDDVIVSSQRKSVDERAR